jgi:hypothetical protein
MRACGSVQRRSARERGAALLVTVVFVMIVLGIVGAMLAATLSRSRAEAERLVGEELSRAAEGAIAVGVGKISGGAAVPDAAGRLVRGPIVNGRWAVRTRRKENLLRVSAAAVFGDSLRVVQGVFDRDEWLPPRPGTLNAALVSYHGLEMHANFVVNGNNHDMAGNRLSSDPEATYGIATAVSDSNILNNGLLSGNNEEPVADNKVAIEKGILKTQADPSMIPNTPGRALGIPDADVIAKAQAGGTYFTSLASFDAWAASLGGGPAPNGSPIYLAFSTDPMGDGPLNKITFDDAKAYIVIHHVPKDNKEPADPTSAPRGIATSGNFHVRMNGILIMDDAMHMNDANTVVNGSVVSLWGKTAQPKFGQGGASVRFSSIGVGRALRDGLGQAGVAGTAAARMISYRHGLAPDADMYAVVQACGVSTAGMPDPVPLAGWTAP